MMTRILAAPIYFCLYDCLECLCKKKRKEKRAVFVFCSFCIFFQRLLKLSNYHIIYIQNYIFVILLSVLDQLTDSFIQSSHSLKPSLGFYMQKKKYTSHWLEYVLIYALYDENYDWISYCHRKIQIQKYFFAFALMICKFALTHMGGYNY